MAKKYSILRFFIVYFCVLLPLLGTSILVTQNFLNKTAKEEQSKLSKQLEESVEMITDSFWEYRNKGVVLFQNKEFSSNLSLASATYINNVTRMLGSMKMFDGSESMILVYYGEGMLYSPEGMERVHTFFDKKLGCTQESENTAMETIESDQYSITPLQGKSGLEYLLFHIPAGKDIHGYARSMEVVISMSQLEKMLSTCLHSEDLLFLLSLDDAEGYFYQTERGIQMVTMEEAESLLSGYKSEPLVSGNEMLQFTAKIWCDMNIHMADFYDLRNMNLILLMVGLLLSVLLSLALSVVRFSQLRTLINNFSNKTSVHKEKKDWMKNEFDYIQNLLDEAIANNIMLRKNEHYHRRMMLKQVSMLIFNGLLREREEIQSALKISGTELMEDYYFLFGLKVSNKELLKKLEEFFENDIHYSMNENGKCFVFVLYEISFKDCQMSSRYELAKRLQETLGLANIVCDRLAMSQVYSKISLANYAYLEVLSILNTPFDREDKIICWEKWIQYSGKNVIWYDNDALNNFRKAVAAKQEQEALGILKEALRQVETIDDARHLRYMFLQYLLLEIDSSGEEEENKQLIYETNAIDVEDEHGYVEGIQQILNQFCDSKQSDDEFVNVIQFVQDNYMNYELSLIMVAEYAGLSKSKTSRLFKQHTGEAYIDYVTRLRMEKAKELLEESDMSVKEILQQVGYLDITNASKKFKAYFHINPSVYRVQKRKEKGEKE